MTTQLVNEKYEHLGYSSQRGLIWVALFILLAVGILTRLYHLGLPIDRDGYDEGVFWQTLISVNNGHSLYGQIFYSQPPAFLTAVYPVFVLFGKTIWSARLGVVIISVFGLIGAALLGKALAGRNGAIAALLLLVVNPFYLMQSQTLQADAPSMAFSLLAAGLAYMWWEMADKPKGYLFAILSAISLSLSIFTKLSGICTLVPIALLAIARIYRISYRPSGTRMQGASSLLAGVVAFLVTTALILLPFLNSWDQLWNDSVAMHTTSQPILTNTLQSNFKTMQPLLFSITGILALYGTMVAILNRDKRAFPILTWLIATVIVLLIKSPLFHHHLLPVIPPLIALAVLSLTQTNWKKSSLALYTNIRMATALTLLLIVVIVNCSDLFRYYHTQQLRAARQASIRHNITNDLRQAVKANQLIITDAQFMAALAGRRTPAPLVDTSMVRVSTGFLSPQQLIQQASRPQVRAVLFYSERLSHPNVTPFRIWIKEHYSLSKKYNKDLGLWVKKS